MFQVLAILDKIKEEKKDYESESDFSATREQDSDWDDEDPEQGIIYVE